MLSFSTIETATDYFAIRNILGEGGFGTVYKGRLLQGQEIVVKRLSTRSGQAIMEFKNEISLISKLQHKNVVRLLGCCIHGEENILVYEYMSNNGLDSFIFVPDHWIVNFCWSRKRKDAVVDSWGFVGHRYSNCSIPMVLHISQKSKFPRLLTPMIVNSGALSAYPNTTATLLDTGNFVLQAGANLVWQSFDYPSDTYLPGMTIGWFGLTSDVPTPYFLSAWESSTDPGHGDFTLGVEVANLTVYRGDSAHVDIGYWDGKRIYLLFANYSNSFNFSYFSNPNEAYFTFTTIGNYSMSWLVMASTGQWQFLLDSNSILLQWHVFRDQRSKDDLYNIIKHGGGLVYVCDDVPTKNMNQAKSQVDVNQDTVLDFGTAAASSMNNETAAAKLELSGEKDQELPMISFSTIETATDYFAISNILGEGGFGPVYKGTLPQGQDIAVKRLSTRSGQGRVEFKNEISLISKLQHRNLVRLLGCCIPGGENILVYEYMPNKSLDSFHFWYAFHDL
ncbi:hypothetical protein RHMOL_Rhmol02G0247400 [Rhododendron molle]|uniref:Uncharacterized protein n=1 Tax=Rhododendron molle TaxID=49168 RepID=A0ACC0PTL8_RHOML|nr:hypothetical protein RHMOL_Rhmol02G0247400 [Rhododendron molle]